MILSHEDGSIYPKRMPRASGDDPNFEFVEKKGNAYAPRKRG